MNSRENVQISKQLSKVLRHRAVELRIPIRTDGFVKLSDLLRHQMFRGTTIEMIKSVVSSSDKKRFQIDVVDDEECIRAVQGHSIPTISEDGLLEPITNPREVPLCVHGTYLNAIDMILQSGLNKMSRKHIHMAIDIPGKGEVISGARSNVEVLIFIDVEKAMNAGVEFYRSLNNVILSPGPIPPDVFKEVQYISKRREKSFSRGTGAEQRQKLHDSHSASIDESSCGKSNDTQIELVGNLASASVLSTTECADSAKAASKEEQA